MSIPDPRSAIPDARSAIPDPRSAVDALAGCADPLLIGVRHHSPACAAAVPHLLDRFAPDRLLVELPAEFGSWIPWLGHPDAVAPIALGAASDDAHGPAFYPFADFSPELAAIRWAVARGIPVDPCDLPLARRGEEEGDADETDHEPGLVTAALLAATGAPDAESLWDRLVETPGLGADPEQVRRAALLYGWALRVDAGPHADRSSRVRERWMRARIAAAREDGGKRIAVVIGSFHAAALTPDGEWDPVPRDAGKDRKPGKPPVTSMMPYGYEQLDSRSGYPAGIRDPLWQQRAWAAATRGETCAALAGEVMVEVSRGIRAERHVAGVPDASEALRLAVDLAALRGLPGPGRREVLEGIETALGRGETLGRGRIIARVLERVLVGRARGRLAPGTPRSGLGPHVGALITALRLPGPDDRPDPRKRREPISLDPLRSDLDRRRHVALRRMCAAGIQYATPDDGEAAGDAELLVRTWRAEWTAPTDATLALASTRGITLVQAATGAVRAKAAELRAADAWNPGIHLDVLEVAAEAGLGDLASELLADVGGRFLEEAPLPALVRATALVERIAAGHVPGLPVDPEWDDGAHPGAIPRFKRPTIPDPADLVAAAVRAAEGLVGSADAADATALVELVRRVEGQPERLGAGRLGWLLERFAADGSPLMQGTAGASLVLLGREDAGRFATRMGSWIDGFADGAHAQLSGRLGGVLVAAGAQLEGHPVLLAGLADRVEALGDDAFLRRLPALRDAFDVLSPAARQRLLVTLAEQLELHADEPLTTELDLDPEQLATFASADAEILRELASLGLVPTPAERTPGDGPPPREPAAPHRVGPLDRWRLILGRQRQDLPPEARQYARALDELYGAGRGEGSRRELGGGAGAEKPYPSVREWAGDLEDLFGTSVRQDVIGVAAARGDVNALLALDPDSVTPSVDLLELVLSLKGGLSEGQLASLRRIVDRVVARLVEALAVRVRPALTGLTISRPTRRQTNRLDLPRTVAANLRTVRRDSDGKPRIIPERLIFRTRGRRSMDWRILLVVDTSGSMEPSVVHSAMMAAILAGLPAVHVHFLAFSTEVVDLSERVDDPLGLLLEVQIGGGTHIGKALKHARSLVTVPSRTILVLVSDFEEGGPMGLLMSEVRALVEMGVRALGLASLDEEAKPRFSEPNAARIAGAGMPVAALTPVELARWVGEQIRG